MQAVERHLRHRVAHSHVSVGEGAGGERGWYAELAYGSGGGGDRGHARSHSPLRTQGGAVGEGFYHPTESVPLRTFLMINYTLREEYEVCGCVLTQACKASLLLLHVCMVHRIFRACVRVHTYRRLRRHIRPMRMRN
jgi:hypothetical protein